MKKYLVLVAALLLVIALLSAGTFTWWHGQKTSNAVNFKTGSIKINCTDGPFTADPYDFGGWFFQPDDMKEMTFNVENIGKCPAIIWKHLKIDVDPGIAQYIVYDLKVMGAYANPALPPGTWQTILSDADNKTVEDVQSMWIPLGMLEAGKTMNVVQSYHMKWDAPDTIAEQQMDFKVEIFAGQRGNDPGPEQNAGSRKCFLDNKMGTSASDPNWWPVPDEEWGLLTWDGSAAFAFNAQGLNDSISYSLITYIDPWPGTVQVLGSGTPSGGKLSLTGTISPNPYNFPIPPTPPTGKVWLVPSADTNGSQMTTWDPASFLFEGNRIQVPGI